MYIVYHVFLLLFYLCLRRSCVLVCCRAQLQANQVHPSFQSHAHMHTCTHAHTNDVRSITCNLPFNYMHAFTHLHRQTTDMHARHLARSRTCTGRFVFRSQDMHQCGSLCHVAHTTLHQNDYTHKPVSDIVNHTAQMHTHPNDPSRNSPSHTCKEVGCELGVPAQAHWNWVWVSFDNLPQTKINHFDLMI